MIFFHIIIDQGTCGGSSSYNNTYFLNPGYPNTVTTSSLCSFTIVPSSSAICQVSRISSVSISIFLYKSFETTTRDGWGRVIWPGKL